MPADRDLVFIVDTDQAVRDSLRFVIELDGMSVRTCGSCTELLAHPELALACCAIVDGAAFERDGSSVLEQLEAGASMPIVLVADHISRRALPRTIAGGRLIVVEKPVMDDALLRCVREIRAV